MDLKDTVVLMNSDDYKERFKAEFWQLRQRLDKLNDMLARYNKGTLDYIPDTPILWLKQQAYAMQAYLDALSVRCDYENIDVYETDKPTYEANNDEDNGTTIVLDGTTKKRPENDVDGFTEAIGLGNDDSWHDWLMSRICKRK